MRATKKNAMPRVATYRLGTYDPLDDDAPIHFVGRVYESDGDDLEEMRATIREFSKATAGDSRICRVMAIFENE